MKLEFCYGGGIAKEIVPRLMSAFGSCRLENVCLRLRRWEQLDVLNFEDECMGLTNYESTMRLLSITKGSNRRPCS